MKLFGKDLFNREPDEMWDFAQFGIVGAHNVENRYFGLQATTATTAATGGTWAYIGGVEQAPAKMEEPKKEDKKKFTPKELFTMSALNDKMFAIQAKKEYIDKAIEECKLKLSLMPGEPKKKRGNRDSIPMEYSPDVSYGRAELKSIMEKLENRRYVETWKDLIIKYPHTTSKLLSKVLSENTHLSFARAASFVPDFPREATNAMAEYNKACQKLCNKKTHFYVMADGGDFQKKNAHRDPILVAQSPFGFFWQILGAWDEEMVYLDEL